MHLLVRIVPHSISASVDGCERLSKWTECCFQAVCYTSDIGVLVQPESFWKENGKSFTCDLCVYTPLACFVKDKADKTILVSTQIVNEDRHLTSLLLLRGWGVIYAGDIMTETETPTTLVRWIRQQVSSSLG